MVATALVVVVVDAAPATVVVDVEEASGAMVDVVVSMATVLTVALVVDVMAVAAVPTSDEVVPGSASAAQPAPTSHSRSLTRSAPHRALLPYSPRHPHSQHQQLPQLQSPRVQALSAPPHVLRAISPIRGRSHRGSSPPRESLFESLPDS